MLLTLMFICAVLPVGQVLSADLGAPYTPTRAEWLRVYLGECIRTWTDAWALRVGVNVFVKNDDQQIIVTLTAANGEKQPEQHVRDGYVSSVTGFVRGALEHYPWAKGLKIVVQFV